MNAIIQRTLAPVVQEVSRNFPILLITGPRQVGKTTLLESCSEETRRYVTLDDLDARNLALTDPGLFLQTYPPPVIIDEIQYAPNLFSYLKISVDRLKRNGLFWLTGSQKFQLMQGISESLAGRVAVLDLLGVSQSEIEGRRTPPFLPTREWLDKANSENPQPLSLLGMYERIWLGSFPRLHQGNPALKDIFFRSYVQTYLQRDIKDILNISDETAFFRFLGVVAARTGQLLNYSDLARNVDIDNKTAKAWLSLLETSGIIYLLHPWHSNVTKRLIKTPKLYFLDTGLCTYLTKWPDARSLEAGAMSGAILETYLFSEILKSYWHNGLTANFYYYRDTDQKEIDLLIEHGDKLYPVEFKKTGTPSQTATKHFPVLKNLEKPNGAGAVICMVENSIALSREVTAIPARLL